MRYWNGDIAISILKSILKMGSSCYLHSFLVPKLIGKRGQCLLHYTTVIFQLKNAWHTNRATSKTFTWGILLSGGIVYVILWHIKKKKKKHITAKGVSVANFSFTSQVKGTNLFQVKYQEYLQPLFEKCRLLRICICEYLCGDSIGRVLVH